MTTFLQFLIIGLGLGATYALFAQGAVLIYRGSGLVNFAQGAIGTFAAYIAFVDLKDKQGWATLPCDRRRDRGRGARVRSRSRCFVLRAARHAAAPIARVIATIGLLGLLQAAVRSATASPTNRSTPTSRTTCSTGAASRVQEERLYLVAITLVVTFGLWAWTRYTRVGLAITRQRAERTGGADARVVARPARRAHVDGRRDARRARRRPARAAHRAVGDHLHASW